MFLQDIVKHIFPHLRIILLYKENTKSNWYNSNIHQNIFSKFYQLDQQMFLRDIIEHNILHMQDRNLCYKLDKNHCIFKNIQHNQSGKLHIFLFLNQGRIRLHRLMDQRKYQYVSKRTTKQFQRLHHRLSKQFDLNKLNNWGYILYIFYTHFFVKLCQLLKQLLLLFQMDIK